VSNSHSFDCVIVPVLTRQRKAVSTPIFPTQLSGFGQLAVRTYHAVTIADQSVVDVNVYVPGRVAEK